jgi:hypothetical protein
VECDEETHTWREKKRELEEGGDVGVVSRLREMILY